MRRKGPPPWSFSRKIRLGRARLDFPRELESLLHRLGVGPPLAAYWGRVRYRFSLTPR